MKTNVIMISSDRTIFGQVVRQETKTGMLNVSDLEKAANKRNVLNGYSVKHLSELMSRKENIERIFYILEKQMLINVDLSTFIEHVDNHGITTTLKKFGAWKTTGARQTKTIWANPYIWMLLALEMSPEIYGTAICWLSDKLIVNRIEAGNFYKDLAAAMYRFKNVDYVKVAKALNFLVFGKHERGLRNLASTKELKQLEDIEKQIAFAINMGYINDSEQLVHELRKMYLLRYNKSIK